MCLPLKDRFTSADNETVVLNTLWGSDCAVITVNLKKQHVVRLTPPSASYTWHCHNGASAFVVRSSLTDLPAILTTAVQNVTAAATSGTCDSAIWRVVDVLTHDDVDESAVTLMAQVVTDVVTVESTGTAHLDITSTPITQDNLTDCQENVES